MFEMVISIEADNNMNSWKKVASELESGLLSAWEGGILFDGGANGCSRVSVEVDEFFLDEEFDSDSVLYGIVDVSRPYDCDFGDEVVMPVSTDNDKECEGDEVPIGWDAPGEWWEESFGSEPNLVLVGSAVNLNEDEVLNPVSFLLQDEEYLDFILAINAFETESDFCSFEGEILDVLSGPLQDEIESEEIWNFDEWTSNAAMYRLTWVSEADDWLGWNPHYEKCGGTCVQGECGVDGLLDCPEYREKSGRLCLIKREYNLGLGQLGQQLSPTVSGIVAGLSGMLSLDRGLELQVYRKQPPPKPPWRGSGKGWVGFPV